MPDPILNLEIGHKELDACFHELLENSRWFDGNYDMLVKKFDGQHVAVYQRRVVDSNTDARALGERLRKNYSLKEKLTIFVTYVTKEKDTIIVKELD